MRGRSRRLIAAFTLAFASPAVAEDGFCNPDWAVPFSAPAAWAEFRSYVEINYAYLDRTDARRVLDAVAPKARATRSNAEFSGLLQTLALVWRDGHFHVTPSPSPVRAFVPSASDIWVERRGNDYAIVDVKAPSLAARQGLRPGMIVDALDGKQLDAHVDALFAPLGIVVDANLRAYAANAVLSGFLGTGRSIDARIDGIRRTFALPPGYDSTGVRDTGLLTTRRTRDAKGRSIAVIRINNQLGDNALIPAFDRALASVADASALVLDLRDTPGGGNTTVARAIIGHFTRVERPYQRHENTFEKVRFGVPRRSIELVVPRAPYFGGRLVVLAGRWTGSMGEGLAIGLDAIEGVRTVGSPLADLLGDLRKHTLRQSCLTVEFAYDRLSHADERPREAFVPRHTMESADIAPDGSDPALVKALALLSAD